MLLNNGLGKIYIFLNLRLEMQWINQHKKSQSAKLWRIDIPWDTKIKKESGWIIETSVRRPVRKEKPEHQANGGQNWDNLIWISTDNTKVTMEMKTIFNVHYFLWNCNSCTLNFIDCSTWQQNASWIQTRNLLGYWTNWCYC